MKTNFMMIIFSLCLVSSFAKANGQIIGNCSEEIASEYSKLVNENKPVFKAVLETDKLTGDQTIVELNEKNALIGLLGVNTEKFECKFTLHKDGKEIAQKEVDVCTACTKYSTDLTVLFDEGAKGKSDKLFSKYESNKLVVFGFLNGFNSEAEIGIYRKQELKKRLSLNVDDEKDVVVSPVKIQQDRIESISFEGYDLEIQCAPVKKMVRHI